MNAHLALVPTVDPDEDPETPAAAGLHRRSPHPSVGDTLHTRSQPGWVHTAWSPPPPAQSRTVNRRAQRSLKHLVHDERGAVTAEYAIVMRYR